MYRCYLFFIAAVMFTCNISLAQKTLSNSKNVKVETNWKPIIISDAKMISVPQPPGNEKILSEINKIILMQQENDTAMLNQIHYWNAGPPSYRWQKVADNLNDTSQYWVRVYAYMNVAIYDATIAALHAKNLHQRSRPFQVSNDVKMLLSAPAGYSYPCEHSVTAGAAATVLSYLFPAKKDSLMQLAKDAGLSRVAAGLQFMSDVEAGLELGNKIAQHVIEYAKMDGFDKMWTDSVPKGRNYYTGKPLKRALQNMKTWVLSSPAQFRSTPPPEFIKDMEELKSFQHDDYTKYIAYKWEFSWPWGDVVEQKMLEYNLVNDVPRAAFTYALISISDYDNQVAHWDGKYTYFRARPNQYDTTFKSLFTTPPSPSYPAGHGTMAFTRAAVLSYLFPYDRKQFYELANEANESRFAAGVHYKSDNEAGEILGRKIGEEIIKWAKNKAAF